VSTDNEDIASVALEYGAEIPFIRPEELAKDDARAIDVYNYTINRLEEEEKTTIYNFIVLQPTSPLRSENDIDAAIKLFMTRKADSVISYREEDHPISWHKYINEDQSFQSIFDNGDQNRQEYEKSYFPNGALYVFKTELIRSLKYYSENSLAYVMPADRSVDIDTEEDFNYAEFLLNR